MRNYSSLPKPARIAAIHDLLAQPEQNRELLEQWYDNFDFGWETGCSRSVFMAGEDFDYYNG
ncbi:uncharacterized protein K444DRAFT_620688 [Hyaloscypha bicolor E]|uniref:Uncharacterized protein n=1 Tax=Hyaloscypha bicolor E TaxID=1095630 RepID=A0A2J6SLF2_9HELO|nr:uncharacterized protein K444DRAFT_620688 [Hyaloscypha bicolor E]PMD51602.1 hypothetical protein K444DRAFT_620688 [Hyaloscypha bicolor E]